MPASDLTADPLLASFPVHEGYKVLGGVVLYQKLGQGGMGAVYRGKHLRLNVDVAVKVMAPPEGMSPSHADNFVQRFIREAQTAASVRHQNLIRVYDVNTEGGAYYLVMDYIDGESAGDRLKRKGKLAEQEAVEIALGAAEGLAEAHAQGIVHRDVKPDNILVDKRGSVVVADLGLAKAYGAGEGDSRVSMGLSLTQQAMGTPYYMSPEQTRSAKDVAPAADVWSLGVTLYQLVSGELPWSDTDLVELLSSIRKDPAPDVRRRSGGLSDGLCAIIERALNKDAAGRYTDCGEIAKALSGHLDSIRQSSESALPDSDAGATKMALVSVTPPPERTLTLIAEADVSPAPASQKAPAPPRAEAKWFYARGDRRQGPFTSRELQGLAARGEITPQTLIWKEGLADWIPASRTKGLFTTSSKFESPPPLPGSQAPKGPPPLPGKLATYDSAMRRARSYEARTQWKEAVSAYEDALRQKPGDPQAMRFLVAAKKHLGPAKTLTLDCGGGVTMELVLIPAGKFMMGSRDSAEDVVRKSGYKDAKAEWFTPEHPQHRVRITKPFYMGKHEVTQAHYERIVGTNPSKFKGAGNPVETVSWNDATEFCLKLSQRTGKAVRLSTEAEWEYACRAGTTTPFHYGNSLSSTQANFEGRYPYGGAAKGEWRQKTMPVGSFQPNAWGLYDIHGNVWEWCGDWYGNYGGAASDPTGPANGSYRVLRGGGWHANGFSCRSAYRYGNDPTDRNDLSGFRVVVPPSPGR